MIGLGKKIANTSEHRHFHHAAIVQKGGAVLSTGRNFEWNHAEVAALGKISPEKRKGCTVWSIRTLADGSLGMAKPCDKCEDYLRKWGVKVVLYSDEDGGITRMKL